MISHMKRSYANANISDAAATSVEAFDAPFAGRVNLAACWLEWIEATGSQTSTIGVVSIEVDGVEVATLTASQSGAIGDSQYFTPDGTYTTAASPYAEFAAGDVIEVKIKTQATGGGTTGEGPVFLALEFAK